MAGTSPFWVIPSLSGRALHFICLLSLQAHLPLSWETSKDICFTTNPFLSPSLVFFFFSVATKTSISFIPTTSWRRQCLPWWGNLRPYEISPPSKERESHVLRIKFKWCKAISAGHKALQGFLCNLLHSTFLQVKPDFCQLRYLWTVAGWIHGGVVSSLGYAVGIEVSEVHTGNRRSKARNIHTSAGPQLPTSAKTILSFYSCT